MSPEPSFSVETPWIAASKSPVQLRNSWISPLGKFAPQPVLFVLPEEAIGSKVVSCVLACGVSATDWWFLRAFCCVPPPTRSGRGSRRSVSSFSLWKDRGGRAEIEARSSNLVDNHSSQAGPRPVLLFLPEGAKGSTAGTWVLASGGRRSNQRFLRAFRCGPRDGLPTAGPLATRLEPSWRRASSRPPCRCSRQGSLRRSSLGHPGYSRRPAVLRRRSASPA